MGTQPCNEHVFHTIICKNTNERISGKAKFGQQMTCRYASRLKHV